MYNKIVRQTIYQKLLADMESCGTWVKGDLIWKHACTATSKNNSLGYGTVTINNRRAYVTRVVWHHFVDPDFPIFYEDSVDKKFMDHKCHDTRCYRLDHIHPETPRDNTVLGNLGILREGGHSSRYTGVLWNKQRNKWQAIASINGKYVYLGLHMTEEDAASAYRLAILKAGRARRRGMQM